jgi:hypothetical protein
MGLEKQRMNIFSKLFGSQKVIDAGISGIDKAFYTEEEKAEDRLKAAPWKIKLLNAYEPFKVAQRVLALVYSVPYVSAWMGCFVASFWYEMDDQFKLLNGDMGTICMIIIGFYFGGGAIESLGKKR